MGRGVWASSSEYILTDNISSGDYYGLRWQLGEAFSTPTTTTPTTTPPPRVEVTNTKRRIGSHKKGEQKTGPPHRQAYQCTVAVRAWIPFASATIRTCSHTKYSLPTSLVHLKRSASKKTKKGYFSRPKSREPRANKRLQARLSFGKPCLTNQQKMVHSG